MEINREEWPSVHSTKMRKNILTSKHAAQHQKLKVIKSCVNSTLLYGVEAWTLAKKMEKKIKAL